MEHKLDELQHQQSRLSQANLSKPDEVVDLERELQQLTAANEVSPHVAPLLLCAYMFLNNTLPLNFTLHSAPNLPPSPLPPTTFPP